MSSTWGKNIKISIFGESHGDSIGAVIDGLPAGICIDKEKIALEMKRRQTSQGIGTTKRVEPDEVEFLSGIVNNRLCGSPVCIRIKNGGQHSSDYDDIFDKPRPSHADYTGKVRYNGFNDVRGGGHFSGRLTAPIVAIGAICKQVLEQEDIVIGCHVSRLGNVFDEKFDPCNLDKDFLREITGLPLGVKDEKVREAMFDKIREVSKESDSIGAVLECGISGIPAGLGTPMFDGIENRISSAIFAIPAVKGIEFGLGFDFCEKTGAECNDEMYYDENSSVKTYTNNNGGILGGISNGMPIIFRTIIKPTASISTLQRTVNLKTEKDDVLRIAGRHDSCIAIRAIPVIECMSAIAIVDCLYE